MNRSEQLNELGVALSKAQGEIKGALKGRENPFFKSKYADLSSVIEAIREPFAKNGLSYIQTTDPSEGEEIRVETTILHSSGQWYSSVIALPVTKADAQGFGSAMTYARRYGLSGAAGVAPEDDDGNAATTAKPQITPTAGAWEKMTPEQKSRLTDLATVVGEYISDKDVAQASKVIEDFGLDAETKTAFWSQLDSKTRSALKREKQESALRDGGQI